MKPLIVFASARTKRNGLPGWPIYGTENGGGDGVAACLPEPRLRLKAKLTIKSHQWSRSVK